MLLLSLKSLPTQPPSEGRGRAYTPPWHLWRGGRMGWAEGAAPKRLPRLALLGLCPTQSLLTPPQPPAKEEPKPEKSKASSAPDPWGWVSPSPATFLPTASSPLWESCPFFPIPLAPASALVGTSVPTAWLSAPPGGALRFILPACCLEGPGRSLSALRWLWHHVSALPRDRTLSWGCPQPPTGPAPTAPQQPA